MLIIQHYLPIDIPHLIQLCFQHSHRAQQFLHIFPHASPIDPHAPLYIDPTGLPLFVPGLYSNPQLFPQIAISLFKYMYSMLV